LELQWCAGHLSLEGFEKLRGQTETLDLPSTGSLKVIEIYQLLSARGALPKSLHPEPGTS
jgi:hypothetical protein